MDHPPGRRPAPRHGVDRPPGVKAAGGLRAPEDRGTEGNGTHVAEDGLTREDVEHASRDDGFPVHAAGRSSGRNATFGHTPGGVHIVVLRREDDDDPRVIHPITAYEVDPPSRRQRGGHTHQQEHRHGERDDPGGRSSGGPPSRRPRARRSASGCGRGPRPTRWLIASGEVSAESVPHGGHRELRWLALALKAERNRLGLGPTEAGERSGLSGPALSSPETGRTVNPTLDTP